MKAICTVFLLIFSQQLFAQSSIRVDVRDAESGEALAGATVQAGRQAMATNDSGIVEIQVSPGTSVTVSAVGFESRKLSSPGGAVWHITLHRSGTESETVIISSTRTESRIENLPTRVEVLGFEEVDEESGVKPGNIASLLGDVAGIQSQQSSAISGNVEIRVQGLPGKYTQMLRDGMPVFGAFAGNFSILQLPPLDLKQIEIVKGSSSTLYGGGAIAGMINLITRKPVEGKPDRSILLNQSTLGETNANMYLSNRNKKWGYTFLAGYNRQQQQDVNGDGYSDVARSSGGFVHPVLYFYPDARQQLSIGYQGNWDNREGGDMTVIGGKADATHQFFIRNRLQRHTGDVQWEYRISDSSKLVLKAIANHFDRTIGNNGFTGDLNARQLSWFSELSFLHKSMRHDVVGGVNATGQDFHAGWNRFPLESYGSFGVFLQDDWRLAPKWTIESGLRSDFNNKFGTFVLPRLSVLYRISTTWTTRIGGGLGYRIPTVFESDVDERNYTALASAATQAERSAGGNWDVNFHKRLGDVDLSVNQSFFITSVSRVAELTAGPSNLVLINEPAGKPLLTRGTETYVQIRIGDLEAYLGYTYTDALRRYRPLLPQQPLIARNKFAAVISYEFSPKLRACMEASHMGKQFREDGSSTPSYFIAAGMVRYDLKNFSFVLNCENGFDYRQSRRETLVDGGSVQDPHFRELWAPIDGRVVNFSVRYHW